MQLRVSAGSGLPESSDFGLLEGTGRSLCAPSQKPVAVEEALPPLQGRLVPAVSCSNDVSGASPISHSKGSPWLAVEGGTKDAHVEMASLIFEDSQCIGVAASNAASVAASVCGMVAWS